MIRIPDGCDRCKLIGLTYASHVVRDGEPVRCSCARGRYLAAQDALDEVRGGRTRECEERELRQRAAGSGE